MLSNRKDPNVDYWTPLLWPCGTEAPGAPGLDWILSRIREHMEKLGVDSANLCCKVNTRSAIVDRLEFVDNMGLLPPPGSTIRVSTSSMLLVYSETPGPIAHQAWQNLQLHASHIPDDLKQLQREGVHVNGKHYNIKVLAGGDMKILSGLLGHCGYSSLFPCIYCIVGSHAERAMTLQQWEAAGISMRDMEELVQLTHTVMGSRGRAPYLVLSHILDYIVDILHLMLRVVPQIFNSRSRSIATPPSSLSW
eukprot:jgi/Tetstr1/439186/TSEL_027631.t1